MKTAFLVLMFAVAACAVESGADDSLVTVARSSLVQTERDAALSLIPPGGASTNACWYDVGQAAQCCQNMDNHVVTCCELISPEEGFNCWQKPLPHTDPGHGTPSTPFAPTPAGTIKKISDTSSGVI